MRTAWTNRNAQTLRLSERLSLPASAAAARPSITSRLGKKQAAAEAQGRRAAAAKDSAPGRAATHDITPRDKAHRLACGNELLQVAAFVCKGSLRASCWVLGAKDGQKVGAHPEQKRTPTIPFAAHHGQ